MLYLPAVDFFGWERHMETTAVQPTKKPVALIIDDNELTSTMVRTELEQRGFTVIEAHDTADAVSLYRRTQPAVVTIDLDRVDGRAQEIAEALFADAPQAVVVAITCEVLPAFRDHLTNLGVREIVLKPYDNPQLIFQTIERALQANNDAAQPTTSAEAVEEPETLRRNLSSLAGKVAGQVLLSSCGIVARQGGAAARQTVGPALTIVSDIEGSWSGRVLIGIDRRLAERLGARLYRDSTDEDTRIDGEELEDALAEIANAIIGNVKSALPGAASHSKPKVLGRRIDSGGAGLAQGENPILVATDFGFLTIQFVTKKKAAGA